MFSHLTDRLHAIYHKATANYTQQIRNSKHAMNTFKPLAFILQLLCLRPTAFSLM